ncbi:MAG: sigma 54-interacting transcriptional regulator [Pirellulaceae bacterium]|nr:sigma 54-interacting transcriptional regulator [Pirellulaceae bacterium]
MQQTTSHSQAYLVIQSGNRWTDILRLQDNQIVTIGRSSDNQVVVQEDRVSRRHAEISRHQGGWQVADLGSRNGTQVAGVTIAGPQTLTGGERITVGSCHMTFTFQLSELFPGQIDEPASDVQATRDGGQPPVIVQRLSHSQWSGQFELPLAKSDRDDKWNFFYRLIFELAQCQSADQAAAVALDHLLTELELTAGGVVKLDEPAQRDTPSGSTNNHQSQVDYRLAVLAIRQSPGRSYHRVSDFLVRNVLRDRQAVLARNVDDDSDLTAPSVSGVHGADSVLCAPLCLRSPQASDRILGLLHLYTHSDQRPLTTQDLDIAVGVADNLAIALHNLQHQQQLADELAARERKIGQLEQQLQVQWELVGSSPSMEQLKQSIARAAPSLATILIRGESGVGKELVARAIHQASQRRQGPLVCLNCAALAPTLLESELFGHEKGAFTGASERKIGKFEAAHRGTLFLDEIGEMPIELQSKFLRVLEGHAFERLGGNNRIEADVRVIAATNRNLEEAISTRLFRSDLYYRLRVIEILVPPLRDHLQDIPDLTLHFLKLYLPHANRRLVGIDPAALQRLLRHSWPGNIRELKNSIERAVVLGQGSTLTVDDLGLLEEGKSTTVSQLLTDVQPLGSLEDMERRHILAVLKQVGGSKSKAAQLLGIERSTLDRKLKRYSNLS